jgi:phosphoglycolate phosphatase
LIRGAPKAHQEAMLAAVEQVYGIAYDPADEPIREVSPNGKTDRQIVREMLTARGVDAATLEAGFDEFERVACERHALSREATLTDAASASAASVLTELQGAGDTLALLTGNLEAIGRHKMELAGLGRFFAPGLGGFGSDAEHRPELVPLARERAGGAAADDTVVIGDTPLDVAAAMADGVRSIGVAGLRYSRADLLAAGADAAVDELDELPALLARWR